MDKNKITEISKSLHVSARYRGVFCECVGREIPERTRQINCRYPTGNEDRTYDMCAYIYLRKDSVTPDAWLDLTEGLRKEKTPEELRWGHHLYNDSAIIKNMEFHGGCTYAEMEDTDLIKIGCDYQHYLDEIDPSYERVMGNLTDIVDQLFADSVITRVWSQKDGKYYTEEEGTYTAPGILYPKESPIALPEPVK